MATQTHTVTNHSCWLKLGEFKTKKKAKKKKSKKNTNKMRIMRRQSSCQLQRLRTLS